MSTMQIREFCVGDESALHDVYYSAVHQIACNDYTSEQIEAWAPKEFDSETWCRRLGEIKPFVVEHQGQIVGYADVQSNGYINHFFVSGAHPRRGIGALLMHHIYQAAGKQGITVLTSDVSRTAQPFYRHFGFRIVELRSRVIRGVVIPNALMRIDLTRQS